MAPLPLAGITVVAIEQAVAAPYATRQLADLGARVIKIERPGDGDFCRGYDKQVNGLSAYWVWLNRSKESLTLDLKHRDAKMILDRLIERADVFVQNLAPGAAERLGLGAPVLRKKDPRLIVCNVSGYGPDGPFAEKKAYDLLIQSEVGLVSITGGEEVPSRVGVSIADIAGGMYAYSGILTALLTRMQTGQGTTLEVSLFDALGEWMGQPMYYSMYGGTLRRTGGQHSSIAPYGPFPTADGEQVIFGIQNEREFKRLCAEVLGKPEVADDPRFANNTLRVKNRKELHEAINSVFLTLTREEILRRLDANNMANAELRSVKSFVEHPQLNERDLWREVDTPNGRIRALRPPAHIEGIEPQMKPIPALGEHSEAILREFGFDEKIAQWKSEGLF
jgi:itaconate CoA-transferase